MLSRSRQLVVVLCVIGLIVLAFAFLAKAFAGALVLPQSFEVGPLRVHYYGIIMALAVGAGWWLAGRRAKRFGITQEQVDKLLLWLLLGGFVGARLYHVASSWQYYWQQPLEIFQVWHGGLSIFGALIGGFVVVLIFARRHHAEDALLSAADRRASSAPIQHSAFNILHLLDWLAPSVVLGQIIGRFGNFFNYEAFGYPTNLPWKMFVPEGFRPAAFIEAAYFHPLFLYEALGNVIVLFVLLKLSGARKPGVLFFSYLILYNVLRFALEHLRIDSTFIAHGIRLNVLASSCLVVAGLIGYVITQKTQTKEPQNP